MKRVVFVLSMLLVNSAMALDNICSRYLQTSKPVSVIPFHKIVYSSPNYTLEVGQLGYSVNGHLRRWPDIHEMKGRLLSQVVTSTQALFTASSEFVFTNQTVAFSLLGKKIIEGHQIIFEEDSVFLYLPKGSFFAVHEVLLKLDKDRELSDEVLGNLINALDAYILQ
jgi:hypothetical protein